MLRQGGRCHKTVTDHQFNADLTIGLLTDSPAILMSDSYRMLAALLIESNVES